LLNEKKLKLFFRSPN